MLFFIKIGKTKQKVVAFVATAFKALLSVTKTNCRLSRLKFYAGNINYLFGNILVHIYPTSKYKKCVPIKERTEKVFLYCCHTISFQR